MRRRDFLWCGSALAAAPAQASAPPIPAIARYERESGGHVGFYAENLRTRRQVSWRADDRFVMCSTFKASLAALVLHRVDRRLDDLDAQIRYGAGDIQDMYAPVAKANLARGALSVGEMCAGAVQQSDNTCANLLLARVGGPAALTRFWRGIGDGVSRLDDPEPFLNRTPPGGIRNTTTPRAMAATLRRLALEPVLAEASRQRFKTWLIGSTTGYKRLRSGLPAAWATGDKTGNNGKDAAGDIAVTWTRTRTPIVIAAYTRGGAPSSGQFDSVFQEIGRLVASALG